MSLYFYIKFFIIKNHSFREDVYPYYRLWNANAKISKLRGKYRRRKNFQQKFCRASHNGNEPSADTLQAAAENKQYTEDQEKRNVPDDVPWGS